MTNRSGAVLPPRVVVVDCSHTTQIRRVSQRNAWDAHTIEAVIRSQSPRVQRLAAADVVLYEVHVKGYTMRHPGVPDHLRGTYAGFARDLAASDGDRQHLLLVARGDNDLPPFGRRICLHLDLDAPPLRTWTLSQPIEDCSVHSPELCAVLEEIIREWGVGAVLVSSLIDFSTIGRDAGTGFG